MLDLTKETSLDKLGDYKNYWILSYDEEKLLITLCLALNPKDLDGGYLYLNISGDIGCFKSTFDSA